MTRRLFLSLFLAVIFVDGRSLVIAQDPRPLPDRSSLFKETQDNLERAQREQDRYAYKERRTELHTNPFGRIGTGGVRVYDVKPGSEPGVLYRTLLEEDGARVSNAKTERQERRERRQERSAIEDVILTMDFVMDRRETLQGRDAIVVTFAPKPHARPQTREGKLALNFTGSIWIDESAREVVRVEGIARDPISLWFGVIARVNEGAKAVLSRERVDERLYLPTSIRFLGEGRAMVFRKLDVDFTIDWFDYRRVGG